MAVGSKINVDGASPNKAAADVTLTGFGTTPVLALLAGSNDGAGQISVTADATPAADATIEVAYEKAKERAAVVVATRCDADQAAGEFRVSASDADGFTLTFEGTPVDTETYIVNYVVVEV